MSQIVLEPEFRISQTATPQSRPRLFSQVAQACNARILQ
jgi:hypothetical protein